MHLDNLLCPPQIQHTLANASCIFACPLTKCTTNDKQRESRRREEEGGRERVEGRGREREGEREGGKLSYLKRDVLTILQSNHLLSPVQKVCVVDNVGPKLWMVQDTRVVQLQIVHLWTHKPVTQTGLPGSLPRQARIAGGRQSADCYTNCRRLSTRHCLQRRRKEVPG